MADARNGSYTMFAADARQYTLTLDFDARTWKVQGNGTDTSGTLAASGSSYTVLPATAGTNNAQLTAFGDTVTGGMRIGGTVVPFVASRSFVSTAAEAAGTYKFLSALLDTAAAGNTTINTGDIAGSTFRQCNDAAITAMAACPPGSIATAALTSTGPDFQADFGGGAVVRFRIAKVGNDKVYLRASPSSGTSRRFTVGIDQSAAYAAGTFTGVNSLAQKTTTTVDATTLSTTAVADGTGAASTRMGTTVNAGVPGLYGVTTAAAGNYFTMRTTDLGFVFAAQNNASLPAYIEIGKF